MKKKEHACQGSRPLNPLTMHANACMEPGRIDKSIEEEEEEEEDCM